MSRITERDLDQLVTRINELTNSPMDPYQKFLDITLTGNKSNKGNYHLSWAYSGVELQRVANDQGGVSCISPNGHGTKRQLEEFMRAFITGYEQALIHGVKL